MKKICKNCYYLHKYEDCLQCTKHPVLEDGEICEFGHWWEVKEQDTCKYFVESNSSLVQDRATLESVLDMRREQEDRLNKIENYIERATKTNNIYTIIFYILIVILIIVNLYTGVW